MTRTILYYPTISIPNGKWLRRALFYFDEVASIVPQVIEHSGEASELVVPLTPELEYLRGEEVFRPIAPESLVFKGSRTDWSDAKRLGNEFRAAVLDGQFKKQLGRRFVRIHYNKLSVSNMDFLAGEGLLKWDASEEGKDEGNWLQVEERTALLYMSMLAQALADIDMQATISALALLVEGGGECVQCRHVVQQFLVGICLDKPLRVDEGERQCRLERPCIDAVEHRIIEIARGGSVHKRKPVSG